MQTCTAYLFREGSWVGAHAEVRLRPDAVDVLQTVSVFVHDQAGGVVEQNADAVITQLIPCRQTDREDTLRSARSFIQPCSGQLQLRNKQM